MYWALTGYVGGFVTAFVIHASVVGYFASDLLWVAALFAFLLLVVAVEAEAVFTPRWMREIARRRAVGILTWKFCSMVGTVIGALVYPVVALSWHYFLDDHTHGYEWVGITLIVVSVAAALLLAWCLLLHFPKSSDAT